jgi:hypothetical protein
VPFQRASIKKGHEGGEEMRISKELSAIAVVAVMSILAGSACTKAEVPSCTDEKVKNAVLDKAREISRDIIVARGSAESFRPAQAKGAYQALKDKMGKAGEPHQEEISALLSSADKSMMNVGMELSEVHPLKMPGDSRSVACGGSLVFTNKETKKQNTALIEFTAQYGEDHAVRVDMTKF